MGSISSSDWSPRMCGTVILQRLPGGMEALAACSPADLGLNPTDPPIYFYRCSPQRGHTQWLLNDGDKVRGSATMVLSPEEWRLQGGSSNPPQLACGTVLLPLCGLLGEDSSLFNSHRAELLWRGTWGKIWVIAWRTTMNREITSNNTPNPCVAANR